MSLTLDQIRTWSARTGGIYTEPEGKPASYYDEPRTAPRRPLLEVAREQAAILRSIHEPVPPRNTREAQRTEHAARVRAAVARHGEPVRKAPVPTVQATPNRAELFRQADELAMQVPAGRYALPRKQVTADGNDITFFEVVEFKTGPRKGQRRIMQIISNGRGFTRQTLPAQHQIYALQHIADDVAAAAGLFGRTLNICAFGPHPLTNGRSRAAGYGKGCATKHGLPY